MFEFVIVTLVAPLVLASPLDDLRLAKLPGLPKIVGGHQISIDNSPFVAALIRYKSKLYFCAGSIISESWVMTAAHCTDGERASGFFVRVGSDTKSSGGVEMAIQEIIQHSDYQSSTFDFDISLLHLRSKLEFSNHINLVALANQDELISDFSLCIVSGWGDTLDDTITDEYLRAAYVPTVKQESCQMTYGSITDNMICAGWELGGADSCQGTFEINHLASSILIAILLQETAVHRSRRF